MLDTIHKNIPDADSLPEITQDRLNFMLEKHAMFLRGQIGGQRAILQYKNLSGLNFHNHDLSQADFTGSKLTYADLSLGKYISSIFFGCDLRGADMSYANLSRADLRGATLSNANLSGADLTGADLRSGQIFQKVQKGDIQARPRAEGEGPKTILSGARLSHANLSKVRADNADFSNADLHKATLKNARFKNTHFEGSNLSHVDFTHSDLRYSNMKESILSDAIFQNVEQLGMQKDGAITNSDMGEKLNEEEATLEERLAAHTLWVNMAGQEGKQLDLSGFDLRSIEDLKYYPLTAIRAVESCFLNLDLSHISMQSATLDGSDFRDCYMENADLRGSSLKGSKFTRVNMRGARLSPLQFRGPNGTRRLARVDLSGSDLRYADLRDMDLRDAILMGVDLSYADLSNADLRRADLTGAKLANTTLDNAQLDKAIIDFHGV